mmetsp:Transcript_122447/g.381194  ORF Transcript_122447/g.381194 Transcript_122447/m.381194 type:complete len:326 (-) Transcript_122447:47-1024(-)
MVRVMVIRHAETLENVAMARSLLRFHRGELGGPQAQAEMLSMLEGGEVDSPLTRGGERMAERLGKYYAPLLRGLADRGKLHFFCSPMKRNLQTASPLVTALGVKAVVRRDLKETGGWMAPSERRELQEAFALAERGDPAPARALLKERSKRGWTPLGMTGREIQERFPWAELEAGFPADMPWHTTGLETDATSDERHRRVVGWLRELRDRLPFDDLVVFISHGGAIFKLFKELLGIAFPGADNTSVSFLTLGRESAAQPPGMWVPDEQRDVGVRVLCLNRIDHLIAADNGSPRIRGIVDFSFLANPATVAAVEEEEEGGAARARL